MEDPLEILKLGFWLSHRIPLYLLNLATRDEADLVHFAWQEFRILLILKVQYMVRQVLKT